MISFGGFARLWMRLRGRRGGEGGRKGGLVSSFVAPEYEKVCFVCFVVCLLFVCCLLLL